MIISSFICNFVHIHIFIKLRGEEKKAPERHISIYFFSDIFFSCCCLKMYSVRRDPNHSYSYSQYWTMNCQQQQQHFIFNNRQMIKTKQHYFWSTKFFNQKDSYIHHYSFNNNNIKSSDSLNSHDISLPVYRAPCTFQNSNKGRRTIEDWIEKSR
jgi:hypothetical protein